MFIVAAAFGATLRYFIEQMLNRFTSIALGTLLINISGSFILGYAVEANAPTEVAVFCGAFTTFGGFIAQTHFHEFRKHSLVYVVLTVTGSLAAAWLGMSLA
jgi:CrcB protein